MSQGLRKLRDALAGRDFTDYFLVSRERAAKLLACQQVRVGQNWRPRDRQYVVIDAEPSGVTLVPYDDLAASEKRVDFSDGTTFAIARFEIDRRVWQFIKVVDGA